MQFPKYGYHNIDINDYHNERKGELKKYIADAKANNDCLIGFIGGPPCPDFSVDKDDK